MAYGMQTRIEQPHTIAVELVRTALEKENLAVLTTTDVAATLEQAFDLDLPPQVALGICTRSLARASRKADPAVGRLVPCSIIVRATGPNTSVVEAPKLDMIIAITGDHHLQPAVTEAITRLRATFARLNETPPHNSPG